VGLNLAKIVCCCAFFVTTINVLHSVSVRVCASPLRSPPFADNETRGRMYRPSIRLAFWEIEQAVNDAVPVLPGGIVF